METEVSLILRDVSYIKRGTCIGVECGALAILAQGDKLSLALGDFDSVSAEEFALIESRSLSLKRYPSRKNESDSELAIAWCLDQGVKRIHVYGALNERLDHHHVNVGLAYAHPEVILYNETNQIQAYTEGSYTINQDDYRYFSVFTFEEAEISLINFSYPLDHASIHLESRFTVSNQWQKKDAQLVVHRGKVLVYLSK
ncbi:MAG TPA: thiamine diphosphokinase [Erysipelotrichaceae bacterium]|nr:thiamine diphosphokinase [Erysipelotrichaceae bacterium]